MEKRITNGNFLVKAALLIFVLAILGSTPKTYGETGLSSYRAFADQNQSFVTAINGEAFILKENSYGVEKMRLKTSLPVFKAFGLTSDNRKLLYSPLKNNVPSGELFLEDLTTREKTKVTSDLVISAVISPVNDNLIAYTFSDGKSFGLAVIEIGSGKPEILTAENIFPEIIRWDDSGNGIHFYRTNIQNESLKLNADFASKSSIFNKALPSNKPLDFPDVQKSGIENNFPLFLDGVDPNINGFRVDSPNRNYQVLGNNLPGKSRLISVNNLTGESLKIGEGQFIKALQTGIVFREFSSSGSKLTFADWKGNSTNLGTTVVSYNLPLQNSTLIQGGTGYSAPGNCSITSHSGVMEFAYDFKSAVSGSHVLSTADGLVVFNSASSNCPNCGGTFLGETVIIQHADGTYSKYSHLESGSPQVVVGTDVCQGLYIARQGNTGTTGGVEHLHFQRQTSPDIFGQSVAVDFSDAASNPLSCGINYNSASTESAHSISPSSQSFGITGGIGSVTVTSTGCSWSAISSNSWITITSPGSGSGNDVVGFSVADNSNGGARTGSINIAGRLFTVTQAGGIPNQPPTINAGADQTITLPSSANLSGTATDDGLPNPPASLTTTWSKVSGAGNVTFGNANALTTTADFSLAGIYVLRLSVSDGEFTVTDDLTVVVNTNNGGGTLSGSQTATPSNVNLTNEGILDWAHWGLNTASTFNHKNGTTQQISNYSPIGTITPLRYTNNPNTYSWNNGTPTAAVSNTKTGVYLYGIGNGFQLTVPADKMQRTLKLYVGLWKANGRLEVTTSDGSASPYIDTSLIDTTGTSNAVYVINYQAASSGQTLTIKWTAENTFHAVGNITLQAASLTTNAPLNQPPTVNAGTDQTITLPSSANLSGSATDDGLPNPPASLTTVWSKVSGPGTVTFGNANSLNTTASFSAAGVYVLRLTANDSALSSTDDVQITVNSQGGSSGALAVSNAASPTNINLTNEGTTDWAHWGLNSASAFNHKANVVSQISNFIKIGAGSVNGFNNNSVQFSWNDGTPVSTATNSGSAIYIFGQNSGYEINVPADTTLKTLKFYAGVYAAQGRLEASLSDSSAATVVNTSLINQNGTTNQVFTINYQAASSGQNLKIRWTAAATFNQWGNVTLQAASLSGGGAVPTNQPPNVNAGADQNITLPNSANLSGTATDDGLPNPPASLTTTWSKISGAGTVTFGNANSLNTTADFSAAGVYVLRLTADDGAISSFDELTVNVSNPTPTNQPPTVNVGVDQTITLPSTANLSGTASDDGLPNPPASLTTTWSKISGPGTVTFGNANSLNTTASFSTAGVYVLRLTADDSVLSSFDELTINVSDPTPTNQPPIVNAGTDQSITLPSSANLSGSATDDGLPNPPASLTTTWSKVSGVGTVTFGNANLLDTTASFSTAGIYILRLTADDGAISSFDEITIDVSNPAPTNQPPTVNAGTDQIITLPSTATLSGSATDDGLPNPPASLTTVWSKVSGAGTVTFGNANSLNTTASFSAAGVYVLRLTANDSALSSTDDVQITVNNSGSSNGVLTVGNAATPANINLTTEGPSDWAQWGFGGASGFNHKANVVQQISNYTKIGSGSILNYNDGGARYSWNDGTPVTTVTNSGSGIFIMGLNKGFEINIPADTNMRTLKLYLGLYAAQGKFEAILSDSSAATVVDTSLVNQTNSTNQVFTVNYQAASGGQNLKIRWTTIAIYNQWGNVTLQAASLSGGGGVGGNPPPSSEFQISSSAPYSQYATHIAENANGDFIATWQSYLQDGSGSGIFARKYNSDGTPRGNEFQVNTYTANNQYVPRSAIDSNGNFVIVWESEGQDGSGYGVYGRRYDAAGVPLSGEFLINTYTIGTQHDPSIAMTPSGDFVVVWSSNLQDGSGKGIYGQRFNAAGVPQGGEFQVNSFTTNDQMRSTVAMDANGNFVVGWESNLQDGSGKGIYGQRFNAAGVKQGSEFRVNTTTANDQFEQWTAMAPTGEFVFVWSSLGQDGSGSGIFAQRFDAAGVPQGGEFQVNTFTSSDQIYGIVAIDSNKNFVIVWESANQDGSGRGAYGQRYNAAGVPQGGEFQVNSYTLNHQSNPFVSKDAAGNFTVIWTSSAQDGSGDGVFGKRFDAAGNPQNVP